MFKWMCRHDWKLVALNDEYHTSYTDSKTGKVTKKHWHQRFYECKCGKRKQTDDRGEWDPHSGIKYVIQNWVDAGVLPESSYFPDSTHGFIKPSESDRRALDPVLAYQKTLEDLVNSLGVLINRDFTLESQYPELKKAADEYHRRLDKYRNFNSLKEKENKQ